MDRDQYFEMRRRHLDREKQADGLLRRLRNFLKVAVDDGEIEAAGSILQAMQRLEAARQQFLHPPLVSGNVVPLMHEWEAAQASERKSSIPSSSPD